MSLVAVLVASSELSSVIRVRKLLPDLSEARIELRASRAENGFGRRSLALSSEDGGSDANIEDDDDVSSSGTVAAGAAADGGFNP